MKISLIVALSVLAMLLGGCFSSVGTNENAAPDVTTQTGSPKDKPEGPSGTDTSEPKGASSPTQALIQMIGAIKEKDTEGIRQMLSEKTLIQMDQEANEKGKTFFEHFVGEDYEEMSQVPEMREEQIEGDNATLQVRVNQSEDWIVISFIREGGGWKLAIFDAVANP